MYEGYNITLHEQALQSIYLDCLRYVSLASIRDKSSLLGASITKHQLAAYLPILYLGS